MREKAQVAETIRLERMIFWLKNNWQQIEGIERGRITFDFAGGKLRAKIEAFEEVEQKI